MTQVYCERPVKDGPGSQIQTGRELSWLNRMVSQKSKGVNSRRERKCEYLYTCIFPSAAFLSDCSINASVSDYTHVPSMNEKGLLIVYACACALVQGTFRFYKSEVSGKNSLVE